MVVGRVNWKCQKRLVTAQAAGGRLVAVPPSDANFQPMSLTEVRDSLKTQGVAASQAIHRLNRLVEWHDWQHNPFFAFIGAALLWGTQIAYAIEHWRRQHGAHGCCAHLAVAQYQAHIQRGYGPGLARASARLDQVAAAQGKGVGIEGVGGDSIGGVGIGGLGGAHASSPSSLSWGASGKASISACSAQAFKGA
jgi:hypothetical protein